MWLGQKIIIFTAGNPSQDRLLLIQRLNDNPNIEIVALVIDMYRRPLFKRLQFLRKKWGIFEFSRSLLWKILVIIKEIFNFLIQQWHDCFFQHKTPCTYKEFCENFSIPFFQVRNINDEDNLKFIQEFNSDLGVIFGGRILKKHIINTPKFGSLNIHKHNAEKYRGGGQTGFVECLEGDQKICVTIHYASEQVDAGDVVKMESFQIDRYDNDVSIAIKADTLGIELYYKCICDVLQGNAKRIIQNNIGAKIYYTTPYYKRDMLWKKRKNSLRRILNKKGGLHKKLYYYLFRNIRKIIFYIIIPLLVIIRKNLEAKGKAPIIIMYYHGVSNLAENWMSLPLDEFKSQIDYAQKYFEIISLDKAIERLRSGKNYKTSLVITFDDGYKNCYTNVLPLMRTYNIPATFFICAQSTVNGDMLPHDINGGHKNARLMDTDEIREILDNGGIIGSHALNHEDFGDLDCVESKYVLVESKRILESICEEKINYFSFPYGLKENMNEASTQRTTNSTSENPNQESSEEDKEEGGDIKVGSFWDWS